MTRSGTQQATRSPEIAELRAFCMAADLGSLSSAARALRISQPAMSKKIRVLEGLAGSRLFERSLSGVTMTAAGKQLYPEVQKLLAQVDIVGHLAIGPVAIEPGDPPASVREQG